MWEAPVAEGVVDKTARGLGVEVLLGDDALQLLHLLPAATKDCYCASTLPAFTESTNCSIRSFLLRKDGLELMARSMVARISLSPLLPFLQVLCLDQQQDVPTLTSTCLINSISNTTSSLIDSFGSQTQREPGTGLAQTLVILKLSSVRIVPGKIVEGRENVFQPQDRSEQLDERLLRRLADDGLAKREACHQFTNAFLVVLVVLGVGWSSTIPLASLLPTVQARRWSPAPDCGRKRCCRRS